MAKTPRWAVFGAEERGFDPVETRFYRKKQKDIGGCWSGSFVIVLFYIKNSIYIWYPSDNTCETAVWCCVSKQYEYSGSEWGLLEE